MAKNLIIIGSKPNNLYGYTTEENKASYSELRKSVRDYIADNGFTDVYSTLDIGAEQIGAEAAINSNTNLHALIPYSNQDAKWPTAQKENYAKILQYAVEKVDITGVDYSGGSAKSRMDYLRNLITTEHAEVMMVYNGTENDSTLYTLNALKKACTSSGVDAPKFLNPKTLTVTERQPFPDRPRLVSEERIAEIQAHGEQYTLKEREEMSGIWNTYLDKLELRPEHKADLLDRGFTEAQIEKFKYKSLPQTKEEADKLMNGMRAAGVDLTKAPGFPIAEDGGAFSTQTMRDGYFCPAWDTEAGMLYGMQIRNCNKEEAKVYGKYTWFSGGKGKIGLSSSQPAAFYKGKNPDIILITEGVLKCNLAFEAMGEEYSIMGMAGVYGQKGLYPYDERNLFKDKIVLECFDADFVKNKNVREASARIRNELIDLYGAAATARMTWNVEGKGIDDFVTDENRLGEDIAFNLSRVIMADSPTEVIKNEWNKDETRHVEIADVAESPINGLTVRINMDKVHNDGFKIQPKIEKPNQSQENQASIPSTPAAPVETPEEHRQRKQIEHMNEWTGRREPVFSKLLPAKINLDTIVERNAGKFIVEMPVGSKLDKAIKVKAEELVGYTEDVLGVPEDKSGKQKLFISDAIENGGGAKSIVVLFSNFASDNKNVSAALKGAITDTFYRDNPTIGRTFVVSNAEMETAISKFSNSRTSAQQIVDPIKNQETVPEKVNENLYNERVSVSAENGLNQPQ